MKALIFTAPRCVSLQEKSKPAILLPTDAIVKITKTTICGTDLHILRGDVGTCQPGRVLGHEGVGVVETVGESVNRFKPGDHVLVSCITSCATCLYCRQEMYSHCISGGWLLGNTVDGTQAEYTRIPHADSSLYRIPVGVDEAAMVMLSDVFPTALECGVKNGRVCPGAVVAIVGSGPVGLAALMTARMYSPLSTIVIDKDNGRLMVAKKFGADHTINNHTEDTWARIRAITSGKGCDVVLEAVGLPATFELCQKLLAPGGTLANIGVHGGPATLHLERLWDRNIAITTRLVDTVSVPLLIRELQAGKLQPSKLITHEFRLEQMEEAYKTFAEAGQNGALKVLVQVGEEVEDNDFW